ncbi:TPA: hypothetical protein DIU27_00715 [Candidatus Collierbacteria bacterium]|nr:hypothetical protein [Candidatus Collierbacteria bacterium]
MHQSDFELSQMTKEIWESWFVGYVEELSVALATVTFVDKYRHLSGKNKEYLRLILKGKPLLDLGAGSGWRPSDTAKLFIQKFGISRYEGVDIECVKGEEVVCGVQVERVEEEVLGFVSKYSTQTNVMSNGFLCSELVGKNCEYVRRVLRHVARVLPKDGVFIASHFDLDNDAIEAGMKLDREIDFHGGIKVWVKK